MQFQSLQNLTVRHPTHFFGLTEAKVSLRTALLQEILRFRLVVISFKFVMLLLNNQRKPVICLRLTIAILTLCVTRVMKLAACSKQIVMGVDIFAVVCVPEHKPNNVVIVARIANHSHFDTCLLCSRLIRCLV